VIDLRAYLGLGSAAGIIGEAAEGHAVLWPSKAKRHREMRLAPVRPSSTLHASLSFAVDPLARRTLWLMTSCRKALARLRVRPLTVWHVSRVFCQRQQQPRTHAHTESASARCTREHCRRGSAPSARAEFDGRNSACRLVIRCDRAESWRQRPARLCIRSLNRPSVCMRFAHTLKCTRRYDPRALADLHAKDAMQNSTAAAAAIQADGGGSAVDAMAPVQR